MVVQIEKIRPVWLREMKLKVENPEYSKNCGVYILFFGDRFYIGKSIDIEHRLRHHRWHISNIIYQESVNLEINANLSETYPEYLNVLNHLKDNPGIDTISAYVLEICESDEDACEQEHKLMSYMHSHFLGARCLNFKPDSCYDVFDGVSKEEIMGM